MKHLCCSKFILILVFVYSSVFGALNDKSAMVYYGENISYPMVGIHDYIIVQPSHINTKSHGFSVYRDKMYAYVSIGEVHSDAQAYKKIKKEWILGENKTWNSKVLDLENREYQEFFFKEMIEPQMKKGFKNFFFDTLDSYQIVAKTQQERARKKRALISIIKNFHKRYPDAKLVINRGFEIIDDVHESIDAVLFESYFYGLGGKNLEYKKINAKDREWLDTYIQKIQSYKLDVIALDYMKQEDIADSEKSIEAIKAKGMIPYISTRELDIYGKSSKNAIKREILTLIDESKIDRIKQSVHIEGALPLEYMGYIQKLYDVNSHPLPLIKDMHHYAGVVIWLREKYKKPSELVNWILELEKINVKVVFATNFSIESSQMLEKLGIKIENFNKPTSKNSKVIYKDKMIGYEIEPSLSEDNNYFTLLKGKSLFTISDSINQETTLAAIMPWGGYAISNAFIIELVDDNIWIIDPFKFFAKALRLKPLVIPDVTTQNGKRLLFTHIDGDGIMNAVEWNPKLVSGDIIYSEILKKYKIPHSVSVIGGEIDTNGLFPKLAKHLQKITTDMYKLDNVEPATHTFSHPYFWNMIVDGNLPAEYRLNIPNYTFSLDKEIRGCLEDINTLYLKKGKKPADIVFWSGDCAPTYNVLKNIYEYNILNINGGDTYITNTNPWLSYVAPLGIERGDYYQVFTGAQNENIYTNEWLGPFWGFKKVIQTFKLTNSPRRLKPIDIYYHLYSGSKRASLNALKYVFDWAIAQDVMPIYTSEYIPMVMDYYTVSMSEEDGYFLVDGMQDIKTLRIEEEKANVDLTHSEGILGFNHFETHTYVHLDNVNRVILKQSSLNEPQTEPYLISSNAKVTSKTYKNNKLILDFKGYVALRLELHVPKGCKVKSSVKVKREVKGSHVELNYKKAKEVKIDVICRP